MPHPPDRSPDGPARGPHLAAGVSDMPARDATFAGAWHSWKVPTRWRSDPRGARVMAFFASQRFPLALLGVLLLTGLVMVLTQAHRYGITFDELSQERLGRHTLSWYGTFGRDTSFLTVFPHDEYAPQHGAIFDTFVSAAQFLLPQADHWLVRAIITGLCGLLGVGAIALCGYELGGAWVAFAAATGLWLYPRYYGAIYNNPKDVPVTVALTFVLWATLLLVKQWDRRDRPDRPGRWLRNSLLLGVFLGVAAAIRVNALIWCAVLAALVVGWWALNGRRAWRERSIRAQVLRQGAAAAVVGIVSWTTMALLWPYVFLSPVAHLIDAIQVMSHYPWDGYVTFAGTVYPAAQLPASYMPVWLVIGSPPALIVLALLGFGITGTLILRTRRIDPAIATAALAFLVPFVSLLVLHPELYNALRQFLFLVPPLILVAAYGLVRAVTALARQGPPRQVILRWAAAGLVVATVASYAFVVADMAALSPYEYTYFSPIVGGLPGAAGKYETDYWASCSKQSAEWLGQNYQRYVTSSAPTVSAFGSPFLFMVSPYLPAAFQPDDTHPNFFIDTVHQGPDQLFPTYRVIHTVGVEGVALCVVKVDPALP